MRSATSNMPINLARHGVPVSSNVRPCKKNVATIYSFRTSLKGLRSIETKMSRIYQLFVAALFDSLLLIIPTVALAQHGQEFATSGEMMATLRPLLMMKKDDFEDTAMFSKRTCDTMAFTMHHPVGDPVKYGVFEAETKAITYNADRQEYTFYIGGNPELYDRQLSKYFGIRLYLELNNVGQYPAENSFGAQRQVSVMRGEEVILLLPVSRPEFFGLRVFLHMPLEEARRVNGDLQVQIITRLEPPCLLRGSYQVKPKIDYLRDLTMTMIGLVGSAQSSWQIARKSTGEILKVGSF